jgi:hypothetical protein
MQAEQAQRFKELVWPSLMIFAASMCTWTKNAAQTHAEPAIQSSEEVRARAANLEVTIPPS